MLNTTSPMVRTLTSSNFLVGLAVGAVTTFVMTNPGLQSALFRTAARTATLVKGGLAEAKERFHDAEAEIQLEATEDPEET